MTGAVAECRWPEGLCWAWVEDCLRWRGEVLHGSAMHWCDDWDGLPVDSTTLEELDCCHCFDRAVVLR